MPLDCQDGSDLADVSWHLTPGLKTRLRQEKL